MPLASTTLIDLQTAATRSDYGLSTLRRHIRAGTIPAVKVKGRIYLRPEDLDTFTAPEPVHVPDSALQDWAARMAATAPAFRPEQRNIIMSAFASALGGE
ncbi:helix-turn-helix domain-containing protein [Microbacterium esteraromaticum]|uniref:helix-turn-helix domain-containing protein n=1 Tax=Microbacterium esteraromaticum TaxID=57043 RepID=UPI001A900432|nr:helix-turn-helix domain-containing protein [Microbacterium esteraromaticum]MBN8423122.1 helix-turn-helix domain-containing protein [Microbacterium esteraromaticum]